MWRGIAGFRFQVSGFRFQVSGFRPGPPIALMTNDQSAQLSYPGVICEAAMHGGCVFIEFAGDLLRIERPGCRQ